MRKFTTGFLAILWIIYFMGLAGIIRGIKSKNKGDLNLIIFLSCINVISWIITIKIII